MGDALITDIIELENEIQRQLRSEQLRAETWLTQVSAEQEERLSAALQQQEGNDQEYEALVSRKVEQETAEIDSEAQAYCQGLQMLSDDDLREVLRKILPKVLPGWHDDHHDVQN